MPDSLAVAPSPPPSASFLRCGDATWRTVRKEEGDAEISATRRELHPCQSRERAYYFRLFVGGGMLDRTEASRGRRGRIVFCRVCICSSGSVPFGTGLLKQSDIGRDTIFRDPRWRFLRSGNLSLLMPRERHILVYLRHTY